MPGGGRQCRPPAFLFHSGESIDPDTSARGPACTEGRLPPGKGGGHGKTGTAVPRGGPGTAGGGGRTQAPGEAEGAGGTRRGRLVPCRWEWRPHHGQQCGGPCANSEETHLPPRSPTPECALRGEGNGTRRRRRRRRARLPSSSGSRRRAHRQVKGPWPAGVAVLCGGDGGDPGDGDNVRGPGGHSAEPSKSGPERAMASGTIVKSEKNGNEAARNSRKVVAREIGRCG